MARRYRPRKEFKFWLYHDLADDLRLMEYIAYLHQTRQFAKTLRNGLLLMWTLGQGDLSVLCDLFPTLRARFEPDHSALIQEFRSLLESQAQSAPALLPDPQPLAARPLLPLIDDADDNQDTIILKRSTSTDGTANFLSSLSSFG